MLPLVGKPLLFRALTVTLTLAFVFGVAEAFLRLTGTRIFEEEAGTLDPSGEPLGPLRYSTPRGLRLRPNARILVENQPTSGRDILIETNSLGFRDRELPASKTPDELRILAIGDSITFGGHLQAEEVYVEQVEQLLSLAAPQLRIEVINAGIGDTGLAEAVDILAGPGIETRPDAVTIGFYLNDSRPPWGFPGELGAPGWLRRHSVLADWLYRRLRLRAWLRETGEGRFRWARAAKTLDWRRDRDAFRELASLAQYDWGAAWEESSWEIVEHELRRVARLSEEHGFEVLVIIFPVAYQVYASFLEDAPQQRVAEIAEGLGFHSLDLLPMVRLLRGARPFYDQCHATPAVNREIAKVVARALREEVLPSRFSDRPVSRARADE